MLNQKKSDYILIMKGGGIKGLAYVGALEILERHYKFNWYAGTSAGAIAASLLASGHTTVELQKILSEKNFNQFKDAGFFKKIGNLIAKGGLYEAFTFRQWLDKLLGDKLNRGSQIKLGHLPYRVTIYASKRNKSAIVFDSSTRPDVPVSHAARSSMSIPFIFTPEREYGLNVFDGGLQNNYPVEQIIKLSNNKVDFIGLYLGPERFEEKKASSNIIGILKELISIWTEAVDVDNLEKYEDKTVIIDPRPISTLKFKLSNTEKEFLLEGGRIAAIKFLEKNQKISSPHRHLSNIEDRIFNHEKNREFLRTRYNKSKRKKKALTYVISLTVLLSCFIGFNKERRDCLIHGLNGISKSGVSDQFNPLNCIFDNNRSSKYLNDPDTGITKEKPDYFLTIQNANVEEGDILSFPIEISQKNPLDVDVDFSINHIDTSDENFLKTEYTASIPANSLESTLKIQTKKDQSNSDKKFSIILKNPNNFKMKNIPIGTIENSFTSKPLPIIMPAFIKGKVLDEHGIGIVNAQITYQNESALSNSIGFFELKIPKRECNGKFIEITIKKETHTLTKAVRLCRTDIDIQLIM